MVTIEGSAAISRIGMTGDGKLLLTYKGSQIIYESLQSFSDEGISDLINRKVNQGESMGKMVDAFKELHPNVGMVNLGAIPIESIAESDWPGSFEQAANLMFGSEIDITAIVKDWQQKMLSINTHNAWSW